MGHEYYYLYASDDNASIVPDDYASLNGLSVGVTAGSITTAFLEDWCRRRNVEFRTVEYDDISDKEADLHAGKIDLDLEVSMLAKNDLSAVAKVGSSAYYLVAAKGRPDLVADINSAMEKVLDNDVYYFSRLQERYFSNTVLSRNLTSNEKEWLADHRTLRVGFFDNYLPFSATDEKGRPIGAAIDTIGEIVKILKLENELAVEFVRYGDQEEGYRAVESGAIDLMVPAYISDSIRRDYRLVAGKVLVSLASDLVFADERDFENGEDLRIGVNRHNLMQRYYSRDAFPRAQIVPCESIRECLDGLLDGTLDGTFLNGLRGGVLLKPSKYHSLRSMQAKSGFTLHMAFAEDNVGLMLLMNRGLTMLGPDFVNKTSYAYVGRIYTLSVADFLMNHIWPVSAAVVVLVALVVALAVNWIGGRKLAAINRELKARAETIERQRRQESGLRKELERKQNELEDALQMAQAASRAKTTFLSNMSHDIRTPMNAIIGFTELAATHIDDPERVRDCLSTISQSSEHLLSLINDVLDMSRIESGKMTLHEKAESLADILHALRDIVHADVRAKRHDFSVDASGIRDEFVLCDRLRLMQVLLNLVSNAVKYTNPGGTISLRVVQKPASGEGRAAFEFRCRDDGIGMGEEFAKTIFEPFTREKSSTVSGIQGTGLGMAITKNIVDMMGGTISVSSKKGEGTEFTVSVEFGTAAGGASEPESREERAFSLKGKRILMADDSELNLKIGVLLLREQGMAVDAVRNGQAAVDRIREKGAGAYDFVLMDVQMPVMDGYEATAAIRKLPGGDRLKIIAFSANAFEEDKEKSRRAGMDGHIPKPLKVGVLLDELKRLVS